MVDYAEQVRRYKHLIPIGPRPVTELIELLQGRYVVEEIPEEALADNILTMYRNNAFYSVNNIALQVRPREMVLRFFAVFKDKRSRRVVRLPVMTLCDIDYVVLEEKTGYIAAADRRLLLELELARGVSREEFVGEGPELRSLLSHIAMAAGDLAGDL